MSPAAPAPQDPTIVCPKCKGTSLLYSEQVLATYRVNTAEPLEGQLANDLPEYEHNDATGHLFTCRGCYHEFPVPQSFWDSQPWG